jgi:hypothetical protein
LKNPTFASTPYYGIDKKPMLTTREGDHTGRGFHTVASQVVTYRLDESTLVRFEVDPPEGFHPAGPDQIAGRVREAIAPAVEAAKEVLEKVKEIGPDRVELKFGVKVSGGAQWLVARAAAEGNFEITLSWHPAGRDTGGPDVGGT